MKPFRTLAQAQTPDGSQLTLQEHDGDLFLKLDGRQLMSSTATTSEVMLAEVACDFPASCPEPRILIGGLGLGFTLRRVLEMVGPAAAVQVAEYLSDVVAWNRELLGATNKTMLEDPRVSVSVADVFHLIKQTAGKERYDAILLDVDNGPVAMVAHGNERLYGRKGLAAIAQALKPRGCVAIWSADADAPFHRRLEQAGFEVHVFEVKAHVRSKRAAHRIYLAREK